MTPICKICKKPIKDGEEYAILCIKNKYVHTSCEKKAERRPLRDRAV